MFCISIETDSIILNHFWFSFIMIIILRVIIILSIIIIKITNKRRGKGDG